MCILVILLIVFIFYSQTNYFLQIRNENKLTKSSVMVTAGANQVSWESNFLFVKQYGNRVLHDKGLLLR